MRMNRLALLTAAAFAACPWVNVPNLVVDRPLVSTGRASGVAAAKRAAAKRRNKVKHHG